MVLPGNPSQPESQLLYSLELSVNVRRGRLCEVGHHIRVFLIRPARELAGVVGGEERTGSNGNGRNIINEDLLDLVQCRGSAGVIGGRRVGVECRGRRVVLIPASCTARFRRSSCTSGRP